MTKNKEDFNIIDAYLKYNKQLIIIISGLSGTNKSKISQTLTSDLKLKYVNIKQFILQDKFKEVELSNQKKVKVWYNYDWDKIKKTINENKKKGILICGDFFPIEELNNIKIDMHFHIKLGKQNIIKKRLEYIKDLTDKEKFYDDETETLIINQIIYPYYLDIIQKSHINKFINVNDIIELSDTQYINKVSDTIFEFIINFIIEYLTNKKLDKYILLEK
jgi:hypothetical protein